MTCSTTWDWSLSTRRTSDGCPRGTARLWRPRGDAVTSVGCNHGDEPSVQHSQVIRVVSVVPPTRTATARRTRSWNLLEVAAEPVEGRSGGGLFSADGMVIGVCNAAEPTGHEGLYATLESIRAALDQKQ